MYVKYKRQEYEARAYRTKIPFFQKVFALDYIGKICQAIRILFCQNIKQLCLSTGVSGMDMTDVNITDFPNPM